MCMSSSFHHRKSLVSIVTAKQPQARDECRRREPYRNNSWSVRLHQCHCKVPSVLSRASLRMLSETTAPSVPWRSTTLPSRHLASGAYLKQEVIAMTRPRTTVYRTWRIAWWCNRFCVNSPSNSKSSPHNWNGRHSAPPLSQQTYLLGARQSCFADCGLTARRALIMRKEDELRLQSFARSFDFARNFRSRPLHSLHLSSQCIVQLGVRQMALSLHCTPLER
jgi:hypothetical protein